MARGLAAWGIVGLAVLAVVLGLGLTGGPGYARKQARDRAREQELMQTASWIICQANQSGRLPETLAPGPDCDQWQRNDDPARLVADRYQTTGPHEFRLCTTFELPPVRPDDRWGRDEQGCIRRDWWPALRHR